MVALVAGLISMEGPAIFRADCLAARASQALIDTETEPTGLAGLAVVDETHAIGTNSTRPDVNRDGCQRHCRRDRPSDATTSYNTS